MITLEELVEERKQKAKARSKRQRDNMSGEQKRKDRATKKRYLATPKGKAVVRTAMRRQHTKRRAFLREYKAARGCLRCGEHNWVVLELHHRDPGEKELTSTQFACVGTEKLEKELAKCDVLCANCHLIVEAERRQVKEDEK